MIELLTVWGREKVNDALTCVEFVKLERVKVGCAVGDKICDCTWASQLGFDFGAVLFPEGVEVGGGSKKM